MPLVEYCKKYSWPKINNLRTIIWKSEVVMGAPLPFVKRYGKRVLIDGEAFQAWVASEEGNRVKLQWIATEKQAREHKRQRDQLSFLEEHPNEVAEVCS